MNKEIKKLARLYVDNALRIGESFTLSKEHSHYLCTVMRKKEGECVRLFNGREGEFVCEIIVGSKKSAQLLVSEKIFEQPDCALEVHLFFAPIKKQRMEWLIEKAVELGVTHMRPILTQNTEVRKIRTDRIEAQIIEASEQCERMDVPTISDIDDIKSVVAKWSEDYPICAAVEREGGLRHVGDVVKSSESRAFLIGPEGGFTEDEVQWLANQKQICCVSLGENILRAETAALYMLSQ